jgi:hypothetical protein
VVLSGHLDNQPPVLESIRTGFEKDDCAGILIPTHERIIHRMPARLILQ